MPNSKSTVEAPAPISAASLILLRDGAEEIEVFMVARNYNVDSFSGALVFPGGKLQPSDYDIDASRYCRIGGGQERDQIAHRIAAVRETFEESGVLLARSTDTGQFLDNKRMLKLDGYRKRLESNEIKLSEIARKEKLELAIDLLVHFSNLVTPPGWVRKRFDTHFYVVSIPEDYGVAHDGREAISALWGSPASLMADADEGRWNIVFPTRVNLSKVGKFENTEQLLENCKDVEVKKITPEFIQEGDLVTFSMPKGAGFPFYRQQIVRPVK